MTDVIDGRKSVEGTSSMRGVVSCVPEAREAGPNVFIPSSNTMGMVAVMILQFLTKHRSDI